MLVTGTMSDYSQLADASFRSLPPSGLLVVGAVMAGGLLMWAFGARLVKPMYAFLFGVVGAGAGLFAPAMLQLALNPYIGLAIGAAAGALAGLLMFRISMAATLGAGGGLLATLLAAAVLWMNSGAVGAQGQLSGDDLFLPGVPVEQSAPPASFDGEQGVLDLGLDSFFGQGGEEDGEGETSNNAEENAELDAAAQATIDLARTAAQRLRAFAIELYDEAHAAWSDLPANHRLTLSLSAALGCLAGFVLGLSFPMKVAAIGSAFIGAGVWTPIGARAAADFSLPGAEALPSTARGWLALWLIVAAIGLAIQWTALRPKADRSSRSS